jgi:NADH-quinone oxidoreductase subunit L
VLLGFLGTPAWPWFQEYLGGEKAMWSWGMVLSSLIVFAGIGLGWWFYGRQALGRAGEKDALEARLPEGIYWLLENKFFVDEFYEATVIRFNDLWAWFCDAMDYWVWNGMVLAIKYLTVGLGWVNDSIDKYVVNLGFNEGCKGVAKGGRQLSRLQNGKVQNYLRVIGVALTVLILMLIWGCRPS